MVKIMKAVVNEISVQSSKSKVTNLPSCFAKMASSKATRRGRIKGIKGGKGNGLRKNERNMSRYCPATISATIRMITAARMQGFIA
jgi:hypothetical protein